MRPKIFTEEEAKQRKNESQKRYYEKNKDVILEKQHVKYDNRKNAPHRKFETEEERILAKKQYAKEYRDSHRKSKKPKKPKQVRKKPSAYKLFVKEYYNNNPIISL